jgi:hypothetical protein
MLRVCEDVSETKKKKVIGMCENIGGCMKSMEGGVGGTGRCEACIGGGRGRRRQL